MYCDAVYGGVCGSVPLMGGCGVHVFFVTHSPLLYILYV